MKKVISSCSGRFHIFDQARELARHGLLSYLIADYPRWKTTQFGVPSEKVIPLWKIGSIGYGLRRYSGYFPEVLRTNLIKQYHQLFGQHAAAVLPESFDYFIGLSSFSLESIQACRDRGILCAVDHGSFHILHHKNIVEEESRRWAISMPKSFGPEWIIERENAEFEQADHIFILSKAAKQSLISEGVSVSKIFVNPCGVDIDGFFPSQKTEPGFRVLQVGGVTLSKGVLDVASAFSMAKIKDAELEYVGSGLENSGLRSLIVKIVGSQVRFTGSIPQKQLKERYHQASVFVLASLADGFGMVVTQAMACGLPVIVTENVGAADLIQDGINGFIVPIRSPETIAEKLVLLRENPAIAAQMGERARETVMQGFSWRDYGDRLATFLVNM